MARKVLLLGGSSDLALSYLEQEEWTEADEIVLHYYQHEPKLDLPAKVHYIQADFTNTASITEFVEKLRALDFVPTHLLHAAQPLLKNERFTKIPFETFLSDMTASVYSLTLILQKLLPEMAKARRGKVVLILSSMVEGTPPKFCASYITSKYALMGLGKALAAEYAPKGISINLLSPSLMETKFLAHCNHLVAETARAANPMGRNCEPGDVAAAIKFLFSDAAGFITGTNTAITGGEVM